LKILIIKLGALGDVVMSAPLVNAIVSEHGQAEYWVLTAPAFADFFNHWEPVQVKTMERHGIGEFFRAWAWIRSQQFHRLYDLQSSNRTTALCSFTGVAERVGNHPRFPYTHHPETVYNGQTHIFDRMAAVLASAGLTNTSCDPHLPIPAIGRQRVDEWLNKHALQGRPIVLLHAGASAARPEKRWPHFAALAARLSEQELNPVWIGAGPDRALNRELACTIGLDATDAFNIVELAALAEHARFALTNDSGPMHILASAGIPVYAFFGPSDWRRNHARGQSDRVFSDPALENISMSSVIARLTKDKLL
jgi:ADP-heptose:LPS heptosyltransferase